MNGIDPTIWQGPTGVTRAGLAGAALLAGVALVSLSAAWRRRHDGTREWQFWLGVAVLLVLAVGYRLSGWEHRLGNDLRMVAHGEHWYGNRRVPQALATVAATLSLSGAAVLAIRLRERVAPAVSASALALLGLVGLYGVRVVSLHLVDALLYTDLGPVRVNWAVEAALLATVAWGAMTRLSGNRSRLVRHQRRDCVRRTTRLR